MRFDEQEMGLLGCDRAMLHPLRHDVEIARGQSDLAIPELNRQTALQHEKEVVGVFVGMPDELPGLSHMTVDSEDCWQSCGGL